MANISVRHFALFCDPIPAYSLKAESHVQRNSQGSSPLASARLADLVAEKAKAQGSYQIDTPVVKRRLLRDPTTTPKFPFSFAFGCGISIALIECGNEETPTLAVYGSPLYPCLRSR